MADRTPAPDTPELRARWGAFAWTPENKKTADWHIAKYPEGRQRSTTLPRAMLAGAAILGIVGAQSASATSIVKIPPHNPRKACFRIAESLERMIGKAPMDILPLFYTDQFGHVDYDERAAFIASMTASDGKRDRSPLTVTTVWPVGKSKPGDTRVLYVVEVQRDQWHNEREGSFDPMVLEPEGYEWTTGYWLFEFYGDSVQTVREGLSYVDFVDRDVRLEGCGNG